ncbi:MAG: XTP/dITP diphosphatase [bacterium]|nr:XTP/dITP diphosphatase [bacterium]MDD5354123.1 XTP/dITP diphosphatase [bacterium]MDD5756013.1 XTP/dITP diphosphatase [bacterium]
MELVLATKNRDKIKEIKHLLRGIEVKVLSIKDYPDLPEVREDGDTLRDNAIKKAVTIAKYTGKWALADDTGLAVASLDGAPGVYSARFAGPGCKYIDNNKKLLQLLGDLPLNKRKAQFKCVIALAEPGGKVHTVSGLINGYIGTEIKGRHGFGYDPVFMVPEYGKTFAQLGLKTKNQISHRSKALEKIKKVIQRMIVD